MATAGKTTNKFSTVEVSTHLELMAQADCNLTGIHVRGKRGINKVKKPRRQPRPSLSVRPFPVIATSRQLSRLESLPTEILQNIFIYSHNVDLPLVSQGLSKILAGHYLQRELTRAILEPWLLSADERPNEHNARELERLLASRFCTWAFFHTWIEEQAAALPASPGDRHTDRIPKDEQEPWDLLYDLYQCHPEHSIRVPPKLLRGPWTDERIQYLRCSRVFVNASKTSMPPVEIERISSYGGLRDAFRERNRRAVYELMALGAVPDANFIQFVIEEGGCNRDIILHLLCKTMWSEKLKSAQAAAWPEFNPMDETLWTWARQPGPLASGDGPWLIRYLKAFNDGPKALLERNRLNRLERENQAPT